MKHRLGSAALASVLAVVVVAAALSMGAAPGAAAKYNDFSEPELSPTIQSGNTLDPGETKTLSVAVQNRHDGITDTDRAIDGISQVVRTHRLNLGAASATAVSFEAGDAPVAIKSGEQSLGTITPGNSRGASLTLEVDDDAEPGSYDIPVTMSYTYIHTIIVDRDELARVVEGDIELARGYGALGLESLMELDFHEAHVDACFGDRQLAVALAIPEILHVERFHAVRMVVPAFGALVLGRAIHQVADRIFQIEVVREG